MTEFVARFRVTSHPNTLAILEDYAGPAVAVQDGIATFAFPSEAERERIVRNVWALEHLRPISN